ncbi:NAD(P)-binding domain-containing protein [Oceanicella sp. SM1341]|uniref:NAD(P)-binding domain-containing protein n=1 Tax=Oceanicella sp. SM1341 TaxID=1548889 RepID=UPI000E4AE145|nr:NAD(P)-binding domain-containing protein [Oceanicella sp. SM1341]
MPQGPVVIPKLDIVVIGGGQAGLSSAYYLMQAGLVPDRDFTVLDGAPGPGGAWQFRWPSLTLSTVNGVHDLPGELGLAATAGSAEGRDVRASEAVPRYFAAFERANALPVHRPVAVRAVRARGDRLRVETDRGALSARGLLNATGTWEAPHLPDYPGADLFRGRQLHAHDYRGPEDFAGQSVIVVGAGISSVQILEEISRVARTTWVTRRPPQFHEGAFTAEHGRAAVARVEERVRAGLPPGSLVSATGLPPSPVLEAARARGVLTPRPMFSALTAEGVVWPDGARLAADTILWATGFDPVLAHLAPLGLTDAAGGIRMTGRLATQVAADPRVHLVGYGPSASTIGANRAGRAAVSELLDHLGIARGVGPPAAGAAAAPGRTRGD